ncbi:ANTAR domain-containing protein [Streptomyces sp. SW4]|nr:ANTAR domain-containing protein [Streptomyces sp. SW4]
MPGDGGSKEIVELQEQVRQLKEAVVSHAVVDQAIGMIVALGRVAPDQGWAVLKEISQHTNVKLRNVAELIVVWGRSGVLPGRSARSWRTPSTATGPPRSPGPPRHVPSDRRPGAGVSSSPRGSPRGAARSSR